MSQPPTSSKEYTLHEIGATLQRLLAGQREMTEVKDRLRRLETRITKYLETQGFDTHVQRPQWVPTGAVELPSPSCSLQEVLKAVPREWDTDVDVVYDGKIMCSIGFGDTQ